MTRWEYWFTPAVTVYRLQKAYLDNNGEEQNWGQSRLDKIMDELSDIKGQIKCQPAEQN